MSSGKLTIRLLGPLQASHDHNPITNFKTDSVRALLAILAMRQGQTQRRDTLATLLAPDDKTDQEALSYLRIALTRLRKALQDKGADPPYLLINRKEIALNVGDHIFVDVLRFNDLLEQVATHLHREVNECVTCIERLEEAVGLVRGDFLAGLNFQSESWDTWVREERERLRMRHVEALTTLGTRHAAREDWPLLLTVATNLLAIEPSREQAYRWLMQANWRMGELTAALVQYERCVSLLQTEFGVEPDDETRALYAQIIRGTSGDKRQSASEVDEFLHNLPRARTEFFGRTHELKQLHQLLTDHSNRLVTLVGPGGIGKTRLAQEAGRQLLPSFPDGVWFVSLLGTSASGGDKIIAAIALALNFSFSQNTPPLQQLANFLRRAELLLILDNLEQLIDDADILLELLDRTDRLAMLCTSRETLNFAEEIVIPLQGFELDHLADDLNVRRLRSRELQKVTNPQLIESLPSRNPAIGLFRNRAKRANRRFTISEENWADVIELSQQVDGSPLGLELAATWVRSRTVAQIVESINESVDFLSTRQRDLPRRHRSMRAVFEASWEMLEVEEQEVFANLSIFRGGFSAEAAEIVADATLDDLDILVEKSLVELDEGRYSIHELIREFAEQHQSNPHLLAERHSSHFIAYLLARANGLHGLTPHFTSAEIQLEERNIWYALLTAANNKDDTIIACAAPLTDYVSQQGRYREGIPPLLTALEGKWKNTPTLQVQLARIYEKLDQYEQALTIAQDALANDSDHATQAQAHLICALCHRNLGNRTLWQQALEQAQQLAIRANDVLLQATILRHLGISTVINDHNLQKAQVYFQQSFEQFLALNNAAGIAWAENNLANIELYQGNVIQAQLAYHRALQLFKTIRLASGEHLARLNLAHVHKELGNFNAARQEYALLLRHQREANKPNQLVFVLASLGNTSTKIGQPEQAETYLREALSLCQQHGLTRTENMVWLFLGHALTAKGEFDLALQSYQRTEKAAPDIGDEPLWTATQMGLGDLYTLYHNHPIAYTHYERARNKWVASKQLHLANEAVAGMIHVANHPETQQKLYEHLKTYVATRPTTVGFEDTIRFYWRCYQAAVQYGTLAEASLLLDHAYRLLRSQIAQFDNEFDLKQFTERIPHHANILRIKRA